MAQCRDTAELMSQDGFWLACSFKMTKYICKCCTWLTAMPTAWFGSRSIISSNSGDS